MDGTTKITHLLRVLSAHVCPECKYFTKRSLVLLDNLILGVIRGDFTAKKVWVTVLTSSPSAPNLSHMNLVHALISHFFTNRLLSSYL
jgi:hypothetical protein